MSFHNDISYSTRAGTLVDVSHPPLSFLGTDSLRSLTTSVYSLDLHAPGAVSWYTLVHLKLDTETHGGITYSAALHLLSQCHFLEYCVIPLHRRTARDSPLAASVAHFTLPYLTELRLEVLGHAYDQHTKFFSCISLPALRYFEFKGGSISNVNSDARLLRECFFPQDLSSLEQLKVEVARLPQAVFLAMLPEMTSLRKLHMTRELSMEIL
ncbi:hypothetical protein FB45DRAFT_1061782 [Roridomyces roridus]|uniref:Uncharacterized protein n=1 Tax=Roridomyces roridus TaxID=1738132 RepID=A0AAD7BIF4_9AGAR|nr:hypothetical protein FB45DRAFT_1061782 [Roridomyces roridus]